MSNDDPRYVPPGGGHDRGPDGEPSAPQYGAYRPREESAPPQYGEASYRQEPAQYGTGQQYGSPYQPQDPQMYGGQGGYAPPPQLGAGLAIASLICGILALLGSFLVVPAVLGLVAVILGFVALSRVRKGLARGKGMAIVGIIAGILSILGAILTVVVFGTIWNQAGGSDLVDCLQKAGADQAKVAQCQQQFEQNLPASPNG